METNQKFIESYMVGLNHEFSRELLWRNIQPFSGAAIFASSGILPPISIPKAVALNS
ncbi:MAG: hypothetical protein QM727_00020 [Niabella sp.]